LGNPTILGKEYIPDVPPALALSIAISSEEMVKLGVLIGSSDAPSAADLAPTGKRATKRKSAADDGPSAKR
jgi:hypothetical protein